MKRTVRTIFYRIRDVQIPGILDRQAHREICTVHTQACVVDKKAAYARNKSHSRLVCCAGCVRIEKTLYLTINPHKISNYKIQNGVFLYSNKITVSSIRLLVHEFFIETISTDFFVQVKVTFELIG